jgi:hypothetical protein
MNAVPDTQNVSPDALNASPDTFNASADTLNHTCGMVEPHRGQKKAVRIMLHPVLQNALRPARGEL